MKIKRFLFAGMLLVSMLLLVAMPMVVVNASPAWGLAPTLQAQVAFPPADQLLSTILVIVTGFAALVGFSKLNAAIVNLLKLTGLVKDGTSDKWVAGLNLLAFIGLVLFKVFRPDLTLEILDGYAGQIAMILVFVFGFIVTMTGSKQAHDQLKAAKIPLIGKSFTNG